jgi:GNAT superfamily N-acetyltransferase
VPVPLGAQHLLAFADHALAERAFAAILADERLGYVWLIEDETRIVGYVVVALRFGMEYGGLMACLDDLFVLPQSRNKGLSTAVRLLEQIGHARAGELRAEADAYVAWVESQSAESFGGLRDLLQQLARAGEVEEHLRSGPVFFVLLPDVGEGVSQARGRRNYQIGRQRGSRH